jgi:hypothetical protein
MKNENQLKQKMYNEFYCELFNDYDFVNDDDIALHDTKFKIELHNICENVRDITKLKNSRIAINEFFDQYNVDDVDDVVCKIDTTIESLIETNQINIIEFSKQFNVDHENDFET